MPLYVIYLYLIKLQNFRRDNVSCKYLQLTSHLLFMQGPTQDRNWSYVHLSLCITDLLILKQ